MSESERARAHRNLNPHAEAIAAMFLYSHRYAHEQTGGSMDFWDSLSKHEQAICSELVNKVKGAPRAALKEKGE